MKAKLYGNETYVNQKMGYTLRMNYSYSENFELHYHDYYEVFLTVSGQTIQVINGKKQVLPQHSMVLIRSGDVHTYIKEGDFSFVNLTFSADTMKKLSAYFGDILELLLVQKMPPTIVLNKDDFRKMMDKLNALNTVDVNDSQKLKLQMKLILTDIVALFLEVETNRPEPFVPDWLAKLADQMKKPESMQLTLSEISEQTHKTREHISRSFKKHYHMTVSDFMNEQRLNYSANLLLNTNLSIIDICYECGFQNLSWFYRNFKKRYAATPAQFRKNSGTTVPL
ncbi:MAG: helix-turn-helix domain-containing protein [Ruminococcaceae bacterium]|nr:helix-turn-helix domain-containing protein [Oscillospiraceae bacterium]